MAKYAVACGETDCNYFTIGSAYLVVSEREGYFLIIDDEGDPAWVEEGIDHHLGEYAWWQVVEEI